MNLSVLQAPSPKLAVPTLALSQKKFSRWYVRLSSPQWSQFAKKSYKDQKKRQRKLIPKLGSPLHDASALGNIPLVCQLLDEGMNVNFRNDRLVWSRILLLLLHPVTLGLSIAAHLKQRMVSPACGLWLTGRSSRLFSACWAWCGCERCEWQWRNAPNALCEECFQGDQSWKVQSTYTVL